MSILNWMPTNGLVLLLPGRCQKGLGFVVKVHKTPWNLLSCQKRHPVTMSMCHFRHQLKDDGLSMSVKRWWSLELCKSGMCASTGSWDLLALVLVMQGWMRNELHVGGIIGEGEYLFLLLIWEALSVIFKAQSRRENIFQMINLKRWELTNWARAMQYKMWSLLSLFRVCEISTALIAIWWKYKLGDFVLLPNYYGSVDKTAGEVIHHIFLKPLMRFFLNLTAWLFALDRILFSYGNLGLLYIKVLKLA